eukprot:4219392-Pyramimonas_sp.AAC.1
MGAILGPSWSPLGPRGALWACAVVRGIPEGLAAISRRSWAVHWAISMMSWTLSGAPGGGGGGNRQKGDGGEEELEEMPLQGLIWPVSH